MLTELQRAELRDHLSGTIEQMGAAIGSHLYSHDLGGLFGRVMLDHAVRYVSRQRGTNMPGWVEPTEPNLPRATRQSCMASRFRDRVESVVGEILSRESDWLGAHPEMLSWYGSELLRITSARPWSHQEPSLTSRALEDVVATIADTFLPEKAGSLSVFDPTCGMGTLLNTLADVNNHGVRVCGQEVNDNVARLAAQNLFIAGRDATIRTGNTLEKDAFSGETYDFVVSDAPYGLRWNLERRRIDERFQFLPPLNDATFLFIQALLAKMKTAEQGGSIGIFLSAVKPLTSTVNTYSHIREAIGDLDLLHSIIALPDGLNAVTNIRLFALIFNTQKATNWHGKTKLIDLRGQYEDNRLGPERRKLSVQALADLKREVSSPKDSAIGRFVPVSRFFFRKIPLARPAASGATSIEATGRIDYRITVPAETSIPEWLANRYPLGSPPKVLEGSVRQTIWDIDRIFSSRDRGELVKSVREIGWPTTRLSAFVARLHRDRSASVPESTKSGRLIVPVYEGHEAAAGESEQEQPRHRSIALDLLPGLDTAFIAGWLNSSTGRLARAVAAKATGYTGFPRSVSYNDAWTLIDEIIIPVPERSVQEAFAAEDAAIAAGYQRLRELDEAMWRAPSLIGQARQATSKLLTTETLDDWAQSLPYPIASALATVLSNSHPESQQYRHFWEATAIFLACYLLGALGQDDSLWDTEVPTLLETVKGAGSSFERATFGTWKATLDRLSKIFREGLNSPDADERARYNQLLGDPPRDLITRILDVEIGRLFTEAIVMRNKLDAHGGTMSARQRDQYRRSWETLTGRLRDAIGSGFSEFTLVRPGRMDHDGEKFLNHAKALIGPTVPFKPIEIPTTRPLSNMPFPDYLYLVSRSGHYSRLAPFVRIGSGYYGEEPDDADFTCYFYSQLEGGKKADELRFVPYQLAREDHIIREYPEVLKLVKALTPSNEEHNVPGEESQ